MIAIDAIAWEIIDTLTGKTNIINKDAHYSEMIAYLSAKNNLSFAETKKRFNIRCINTNNLSSLPFIEPDFDLDGFSISFYAKLQNRWLKGDAFDNCFSMLEVWKAFLATVADLRSKFTPNEIAYAYNRDELDELRSMLPLYEDIEAPPVLSFSLSEDANKGILLKLFTDADSDSFNEAYSKACHMCIEANVQKPSKQRFINKMYNNGDWLDAIKGHIAYWQAHSNKLKAKPVSAPDPIAKYRSYIASRLNNKHVPTSKTISQWQETAALQANPVEWLEARIEGHIAYWLAH